MRMALQKHLEYLNGQITGLIEHRDWLATECAGLSAYGEELEIELSKIKNSRLWKWAERHRKILRKLT